MADSSRARLFFDEIIGRKPNAFEFLASLVDGGEGAAENGWRDYKEAGFLGKTRNRDKEKADIKRTWSENLSSFANTAGGVLIWGLHTKGRIPDRLSLASDCEELADVLRSLVNDATDTYVCGVEVEAVKEPTDPKAGFVVCYVPPSASAPHQAQWGERTYFVRVQDSNLPCPPPLLRHMFYPRVQARLEAIVTMTAEVQSGGGIAVTLDARIQNVGPGTAEVAVVSIEPGNGLGSAGVEVNSQCERIGRSVFRYLFPLPPGFMPDGFFRMRGASLRGGASVAFRFFTHNTPEHRSIVTFTEEEIWARREGGRALERLGRSELVSR